MNLIKSSFLIAASIGAATSVNGETLRGGSDGERMLLTFSDCKQDCLDNFKNWDIMNAADLCKNIIDNFPWAYNGKQGECVKFLAKIIPTGGQACQDACEWLK